MHQHSQRSNRAQTHVSHEGRSNQDTVAKAVHAVTREHGPTARTARLGRGVVNFVFVLMFIFTFMAVLVVMVFVPVVPQLGFVQQEKEHQANQQRHEQIFGSRLAFKSFGQQVHERRGHQRTGSQAEHVLRIARQNAEAQQCCQPHAANACDQRTDQNSYQSHS